jgi:hypothetical protein
VRGSQDVNQRNRLTDEFRAIGNMITRDLRRSGYWGANLGTDEIWNNPFTVTAETDLLVHQMSGEADHSCVLFSYDLDHNGSPGDLETPPGTQERFGFRLNNQSLETFTGGTWSCNDGNWKPLSTPGVLISTLDFTLNATCINVDTELEEACPCSSGASCQHLRRVDFTLSGQLESDPDVTESLFESINIRNDKFVLAVP